ncbi:uncharacterized protein LOC111038947 [Myzus persicae]|uniref:uncharacterized protein LOC111038947 n=1 Tax=Myzus persicae TaxID=13164 RepID=UPI000B935034|nr:uncharacterized protein LOC111038947 [Myzus persicae]
MKMIFSTSYSYIHSEPKPNGLPAIVRFKNNHNHLVLKVTELPLLKSITDNNVKIKFDNGFESSKIFQAYNIRNRSNRSPSVVHSSNSSESNVGVVETNNLSTSNQSIEHDLLSNFENVKIQCCVVETKNDEHLEPGQQIINNGDRNNGACYQLVDTSYSKEYYQKVRGIIADHEKTKWLGNKIKTEEDQLSLYKCSGEKCNAVYRNMTTFEYHLNVHCHNAKSQKETCDFMMCVYCFKSFDVNNVDALAYHIFNNYSFCNYFCRYCLYRAYTASHVLTHEKIFS